MSLSGYLLELKQEVGIYASIYRFMIYICVTVSKIIGVKVPGRKRYYLAGPG